jgi:hypothetical protein
MKNGHGILILNGAFPLPTGHATASPSVDVPTVSRWLGHKDGGQLAMKVYSHLRPAHSDEMIAQVSFEQTPAATPCAIAGRLIRQRVVTPSEQSPFQVKDNSAIVSISAVPLAY